MAKRRPRGPLTALVLLALTAAGVVVACGGGGNAADDGDDPDPVGVTIEPDAAATPEEAASSVWLNLAGPKYPYLKADTTGSCYEAMGPDERMEAVADRLEALHTTPESTRRSDRSAAEAESSGEAMVSVSIERLDVGGLKAETDAGATSLDRAEFDLEPLVIPPMRYVKTDDGWKLDDERCGSLVDLIVAPT